MKEMRLKNGLNVLFGKELLQTLLKNHTRNHIKLNFAGNLLKVNKLAGVMTKEDGACHRRINLIFSHPVTSS